MKFNDFRQLCLSMPGVEEIETWGEATFRVRGRMFALGWAEGKSVSIKATHDDQAGLIAMDPKTFAVSAYVGRFGWVTVKLTRIGPEMAERLIKNAWELTAPRHLIRHSAVRTPAIESARRPRVARSARGSRHL